MILKFCTAFISFVLLSMNFWACSTTSVSKLDTDQNLNFLQQHLNQLGSKIKTCRGRAWINIRSPEGTASFLASIAIDRSTEEHPRIRLEASDPFGTVHHLILQDGAKQLVWADFDRSSKTTLNERWHGVPLALLGDLILGIAPNPERLRWKNVGWSSTGEDKVTARSSDNSIEYTISHSTSGRLQIAEIVAHIDHYDATLQNNKFQGARSYYLPQEVSLTTSEAQIKLNWREQEWNDDLSSVPFRLTEEQGNRLTHLYTQ